MRLKRFSRSFGECRSPSLEVNERRFSFIILANQWMLFSSAEEWFQAIGTRNYSAVRANIATYQKSVDERGETGLMRAVRAKDTEMVHLLASFEHSLRNSSGYTALMIAASINSADICQKLAPYEMNIATENSRSALMIAAMEGSIDAIISLLPYQKCRADVDGRTAMMHAVLNRRFDAVKQLSLRETGYTDLAGKTAYVLALELDFQEIANFLAPLEGTFLSGVRRSLGSMERQSVVFSNLTNTTIHSSMSPQPSVQRSSQAHTSITHTSNTHPTTTTGSGDTSKVSTSRDSRSDVRSSASQQYSSSVEPPPYASLSAKKPKSGSSLGHISSMPPHRAGSNLGGREKDDPQPESSKTSSITPAPNVQTIKAVLHGKPNEVSIIRTSLLGRATESDNEHLALEDLSTRRSMSMDSRSSLMQAYANTFREVNSLRQSMSVRSSQLSRSSAHIDAQQRLQLASTVTDRMDSLEMKMVALVQSNMELAAENQALKARMNKGHDGSGADSMVSLADTQSVSPGPRKSSLFSKPADTGNDPSEGEVLYDARNSILSVNMPKAMSVASGRRSSTDKSMTTGPDAPMEQSTESNPVDAEQTNKLLVDMEQKDKELERLTAENLAYQKQILELTNKLSLTAGTPSEKLTDVYPADFCQDSGSTSLSDIDIVCHDLSEHVPPTSLMAPPALPPTTRMSQERRILELESQKEALAEEVARLEHLLHQKIAEQSLMSSQIGKTQNNEATEMSSPTLSEADPMDMCQDQEPESVRHLQSSADSKPSEQDRDALQRSETSCPQTRDFGLCTDRLSEPHETSLLSYRQSNCTTGALERDERMVYEERIEELEAQLKMYQKDVVDLTKENDLDTEAFTQNRIDSPQGEISLTEDDTVETLRQKVTELKIETKKLRANSRIAERRLEKVESINDDLLDIVQAKENEIMALQITLDKASTIVSPKFVTSRLGLTEMSLERKDMMSTASASYISDNSTLAFGQHGAPTTQAIQSMLGISDSKLNESHEFLEQRDVPQELMGPTNQQRNIKSTPNPFSPFDYRTNINTRFFGDRLNVMSANKRKVMSAEIGSRTNAHPLRAPTSAFGTPAPFAGGTAQSPKRSQSATTGAKSGTRLDGTASRKGGGRPSSGITTWRDDLSINYTTRDMYHSTHSISDLSVNSPEKVDETLHNLHVSIVDCVRASVDNPEERASLGSTHHEQDLSTDALKLMEKLDCYQNDITEFTEKNAKLMERLDKLDTEYRELSVIHQELVNAKKVKEEVITSLEQLSSQASRRGSSVRASETGLV